MRGEAPGASGLWTHYLVIALGLWLLSSPFAQGAASPAQRASDLSTGAALIALSSCALVFRLVWMKWVIAVVGLWITFAPLAFWAPDAASYANGTVIGTLVIVASVVLPTTLTSASTGRADPDKWTYNPSAWRQRIPIIGLAFLGFLLARYLSAFQLGHIRSVWEPFFGKGTETILTSEVSRAFPVSDAGLGAWSYLLDAISGAIGGTRRWRTMPWVVILFGLMIVPPGVTSITLVILQPVAVGAWCTICLATAVIMLLMVPPAIDEVVATAQVLARTRKERRSLWRAFWFGVPEAESPEGAFPRKPAPKLVSALPWTLVACALLGIWLMASPALFGARGLASDANHLSGALIATFAVIAVAQVARPVRFLNAILGIILALGIWLLPGSSVSYRASSALTGVLLFLLSLPLGPIRDSFGSYDRVIRWVPWRRLKRDREEEKMAA